MLKALFSDLCNLDHVSWTRWRPSSASSAKSVTSRPGTRNRPLHDGLFAGLFFSSVALLCSSVSAKTLVIAYAGSMGPLMDQYIGPGFAKAHNIQYQGIGRGAFGLARMIKARQMNPDVFISITRGPIQLLAKAGMAQNPLPFARTRMVLAWSPHSSLAKKFLAVKNGADSWYKILEMGNIRFGRTDPLTDPQGEATVLCLMLAAKYYHQPLLAQQILGQVENPSQIFTEASLIFRLRAGQLDACVTYQSAARAAALPFLQLPPEINLGESRFRRQYSSVSMQVRSDDGHIWRFKAHPLIFYSTILRHSHHPRIAAEFARYLFSKAAKVWMRKCGYIPIAAKTEARGVNNK